MKKLVAFSIAVGFWLIPVGILHAVDFPLSQYGQIKNVQNYSSNPFYNPDSPYNQRLPTPVYAQGTELNAGECRAIVDMVVMQQCGIRNNCDGMSYSDIRPAIIVQLSNMSGHDYVTSCNGYIQGSFEDYMKNSKTVKPAAFPMAFPSAITSTTQSSNTLALNNPYERNNPQWLKDRVARQDEMRELQRQNGSDDVALEATAFPTTYADLSFTERMDNDKAGYEPWKDASGYKPITVESDLDRYERETDEVAQKAELEGEKKKLLELTNFCAWCYKYQTECYSKLITQIDNLNKDREKNACAAKKYREPISYSAWDVVTDDKCGWVLKDNAKVIVLDDFACGKSDPNFGALMPCAKDEFGEAGVSGETKPCKTTDGKDGTRSCLNGVWGTCTEGTAGSNNGTGAGGYDLIIDLSKPN